MKYKVVLYCPDRHIEYDGETPYKIGVGGGITARVRMAKAFANLGHNVTSIANSKQEKVIDNVHYIPLDDLPTLQADVLLLSTSGDLLDLSPVLDLNIEAGLIIVWVHGETMPKALDLIPYDYVYAVSNFIAGIVSRDWRIPKERIFVTRNSFDEEIFKQAEADPIERDPYQLVYFSHPSKGLEAALQITRFLRSVNPSFHLEVLGDEELWGGRSTKRSQEPGITYRGMVGQLEVVRALLRSTYAIQIQSRLEPGPLAAVEAMRAGCVVLASKVGAYVEYINDGLNGFLFKSDPSTSVAIKRVSKKILELHSSHSVRQNVINNARSSQKSSQQQARDWVSHWDSVQAA